MNAPLDCTDIKVLLSGIIDDEIDASTRHHAERHLAECDPCRRLVDEMESLNQVVTAEAESHVPDALPAAMMGNVMSRTVYADLPARAGLGSVVNWLGWLAAAACVVLALTVLWMNQDTSSPVRVAQNPTPEIEQLPPGEVDSPRVERVRYVSTVFDGDILPESAATIDVPVLDEHVHHDEARPIILEAPTEPATPNEPEPGSALRRDDAEALDTAALLMERLAIAEAHTFADVEVIRQVALYEDLLTRLAETRLRVHGTRQSIVFAAETVLLRIVHGPISIDDLKALRAFARTSALHDQLRELTTGAWQEPSV